MAWSAKLCNPACRGICCKESQLLAGAGLCAAGVFAVETGTAAGLAGVIGGVGVGGAAATCPGSAVTSGSPVAGSTSSPIDRTILVGPPDCCVGLVWAAGGA